MLRPLLLALLLTITCNALQNPLYASTQSISSHCAHPSPNTIALKEVFPWLDVNTDSGFTHFPNYEKLNHFFQQLKKDAHQTIFHLEEGCLGRARHACDAFQRQFGLNIPCGLLRAAPKQSLSPTSPPLHGKPNRMIYGRSLWKAHWGAVVPILSHATTPPSLSFYMLDASIHDAHPLTMDQWLRHLKISQPDADLETSMYEPTLSVEKPHYRAWTLLEQLEHHFLPENCRRKDMNQLIHLLFERWGSTFAERIYCSILGLDHKYISYSKNNESFVYGQAVPIIKGFINNLIHSLNQRHSTESPTLLEINTELENYLNDTDHKKFLVALAILSVSESSHPRRVIYFKKLVTKLDDSSVVIEELNAIGWLLSLFADSVTIPQLKTAIVKFIKKSGDPSILDQLPILPEKIRKSLSKSFREEALSARKDSPSDYALLNHIANRIFFNTQQ